MKTNDWKSYFLALSKNGKKSGIVKSDILKVVPRKRKRPRKIIKAKVRKRIIKPVSRFVAKRRRARKSRKIRRPKILKAKVRRRKRAIGLKPKRKTLKRKRKRKIAKYIFS